MGSSRQVARRPVARLVLVATTGLALAACSGGGTSTSSTSTPLSSSAPSSTTTSSSGSGWSTPSNSTSPSSSSSSTSSSTTRGSSSSSTTSGPAVALSRCTAATTTTKAVTQPGSGAAGSFVVELVTRNTGRSACSLQGYPGVSLTAPGSGAQIGAAASRDSGQAVTRVRIAPGRTATAVVRVGEASNYGARCHQVKAAGFRVYLPGETRAQFAPYSVEACSNTAAPLLSVRPFRG